MATSVVTIIGKYSLKIYFFLFIFWIFFSIYNMINFLTKKDSNTSIAAAIMHTVPVLIVTLFATLWVVYSPTRILQTQPHYILLSIGFLFANLVGKTVLARVCGRMPVNWFQPLVLPLVFGYLNAILKE